MITSRWIYSNVSFTLLLLLSIGCGGGASEPQKSRDVEGQGASAGGKASEYVVALGSTDLAVGKNRVSFGVIKRGVGPIRGAEVQVQTFAITDTGHVGPKQTAAASFREWPGGAGGAYVANLDFDREGDWGLAVESKRTDGTTATATVRVPVQRTSRSPAIGAPAAASGSKTWEDVTDIGQLTTDPHPDPDLYAMTIAEALQLAKPLLVTFATPGYCQSATCGPQVDVVKELKDRHIDDVTFLHVEVYDNPDEIQGDLRQAKISPILAEWGLATEPWTFVVDAQGMVRSKFEGFVGSEDLEDAIQSVIE